MASIGINTDGTPKPAIWTAWNERENIRAWTSKFDMLFKLEEGIAKACGPDASTKSLVSVFAGGRCGAGLEETNDGLRDRLGEPLRPVAAFVSFETPFHKDLALRRKEIVVGKTVCAIDEAPEPESIQYQNLQTSDSEKRIRSVAMNMVTVGLILLAAIGIVRVQIAVGAMAFLEDCSLIWGPTEDETVTADSPVCPSTLIPGADEWVFDLERQYTDRMALPSTSLQEIEEDSIYIVSQDGHILTIHLTQNSWLTPPATPAFAILSNGAGTTLRPSFLNHSKVTSVPPSPLTR